MEAGAFVVDTAAEVFEASDMIIKVKEPQPHEFSMIKENQIVFTFFHFTADEKLTRAFIDTGAIGVAFETVESRNGRLPILAPMSEIAGRSEGRPPRPPKSKSAHVTHLVPPTRLTDDDVQQIVETTAKRNETRNLRAAS